MLFSPHAISDSKLKELINLKTVRLADFYDEEWMPCIIHFENSEHLNNLLLSTNFEDVSDSMKKFNVIRNLIVQNSHIAKRPSKKLGVFILEKRRDLFF